MSIGLFMLQAWGDIAKKRFHCMDSCWPMEEDSTIKRLYLILCQGLGSYVANGKVEVANSEVIVARAIVLSASTSYQAVVLDRW